VLAMSLSARSALNPAPIAKEFLHG
jgi:hypothetical protein